MAEKVKVFISWSGELSRKVAEAVRNWLPATLQFVTPYFTPSDLEKGMKWASDITTELSKSHVGIICLTRENLRSPWILFEAGALSKNLDRTRVCPLLLGLEPAEVVGPLEIFQATQFKKEDFTKLMETINNAGGDSKLDKSVLESVVDKWWPDLKEQTDKILAEHQPAPEEVGRPVPEMVKEILDLTRIYARKGNSSEGRMQQYVRYMAPADNGIPFTFIESELPVDFLPHRGPPRVVARGSYGSPPRVPPSSSPEPSPSPEGPEDA
jgi:hypothetical protein